MSDIVQVSELAHSCLTLTSLRKRKLPSFRFVCVLFANVLANFVYGNLNFEKGAGIDNSG